MTATPLVASLSHGRNEAEWLGKCLRSICNQTLKPYIVMYVDDGSTDGSEDEALMYTQWVYMLLDEHEDWTTSPNLAKVYNVMFGNLEGIVADGLPKPEFYFIGGCDAVYPSNYLELLVAEMQRNPKLAICSGVFRDEPCAPKFARGLGRLIRASFWDTHVQRVPIKVDWETEPIRIAAKLGYEVQSFPNVKFDGRPTGERR